MTVYLPAHIYVDKCITLKDAMRACETPQETLHELFTICQNLTKLLQMQHRRSIVLRDINVRNVVKANFGTSRTWTLLEYCNASRAGLKSDYLPAWSTPPEVRAVLPRQKHALATVSAARVLALGRSCCVRPDVCDCCLLAASWLDELLGTCRLGSITWELPKQ